MQAFRSTKLGSLQKVDLFLFMPDMESLNALLLRSPDSLPFENWQINRILNRIQNY